VIGTVVKRCCHDLICGVMWIGKDVKESIHGTNLTYDVDWNRCERMLS
jgi:hypothetical protein